MIHMISAHDSAVPTRPSYCHKSLYLNANMLHPPNFFWPSFILLHHVVNPLSATKYVFFFLKGKKVQNGMKHTNMYLEVILDLFPQNHMFQTILILLTKIKNK